VNFFLYLKDLVGIMMITVKEIVKKYLEDNNYDGLFNEYDCACNLKNIMHCECQLIPFCVPDKTPGGK
jgi:hypothetical protein